MVLDLDETLIHSHHDGVLRQTVKPGTPPDFVLKVIASSVVVISWFSRISEQVHLYISKYDYCILYISLS